MAIVEPKDEIALQYQGKVVQYFLESEEVQEALDRVRQSAIQKWEKCADPVERERCWQKLQVLQDFKRELRALQHQGALTD